MKLIKIHPSVYSIVLILILWQISAQFVNSHALFPSVTDVILTLTGMMKQCSFYQDIASTLLRGMLGFIIAFLLAFILASVSIHRSFWKSFIQPVIITIRSVPVISIVLIALLWFSPPSLPVFIALLTMFPILYQNILSGLEQTDIKLIEMAKVFHKNTWQRFFLIYLPGARKLILDGMATALGFGWRAIIIGEALANPVHAIGTGMKKAQAYIQMDELIAWTVIAVLISFAFDYLLRKLNKFNIKSGLTIQEKIKIKSVKNTDYLQIGISGLNKKFNNISLIENLNIQLEQAGIYWLNSASGTGKTTLMKIIAGLTKKDQGEITMQSNLKIAFVFQENRLIPWLTVRRNIAFSLQSYPFISKEDERELERLMQMAGISAVAEQYPPNLSGGEARRVELLRALISKADVLLLDEPTTGLDIESKTMVIQLIEEYIIQNQPITIWASHEKTDISIPGNSITLKTDNLIQ
jgi:ABC-type nitrate/sulfonate/bicarbonate transport system permease component/ABC-type nitrate/sulfonate/bicarbonate transport system ATPase subunit